MASRPRRNQRVPKKQQLTELELSSSDEDDDDLPTIVNLSQSSTPSVDDSRVKDAVASNSQKSTTNPTSAKNSNSSSSVGEGDDNDNEALQVRARDKIAACPYLIDSAKDVNYNVASLLWHRVPTKNKKKKLWMPCRKAEDDEATSLYNLKPRKGRNEVLIKYIGDDLKDAGNYVYVPTSQLEPLVDPTNPKRIATTSLSSFMDSIPSLQPRQRVLERQILITIVNECWKHKPTQPTIAPVASFFSSEDVDSTNNEKVENNNNTRPIVSDFWDNDDDELDIQPAASSSKVQRKSWDPNDKPKKKQTLRKGCVVRFYDPNAVAGKDLLQAEVVRVTPGRNEHFKLHLNGFMLRREDRVMLVKKVLRGKLVDNEERKLLPIHEYNLEETKGENHGEWSGNRLVQQIIALKDQELLDVVASNPENKLSKSEIAVLDDMIGSNAGGRKRRASVAVTPAARAAVYESPKKKMSVKPTSKRAGTPRQDKTTGGSSTGGKAPTSFAIQEAWWKETNQEEILTKIKAIQSSTGTGTTTSRRNRSRGVHHHLSEENLQCVLQVRRRLFLLAKEGRQSVDGILSEILDDDKPFTLLQITKFLSLDKQKLVKSSTLNDISRELRIWLGPQDDIPATKDTSNQPMHQTTNGVGGKKVARECGRKRRASMTENAAVRAKLPPKSSLRKTMGGRRAKNSEKPVAKSKSTKEKRSTNDVASENWWKENSSTTAKLEFMIKTAKGNSTTGTKSRRSRSTHHMSEELLRLAVSVRKQIETVISDPARSVGTSLTEIEQQRQHDPFDKLSIRRFLDGDTKALICQNELCEIAKDMKAWMLSQIEKNDSDFATTTKEENSSSHDVALQAPAVAPPENESTKPSGSKTCKENTTATSTHDLSHSEVDRLCKPGVPPQPSSDDNTAVLREMSNPLPSAEGKTPRGAATRELSATVSDDSGENVEANASQEHLPKSTNHRQAAALPEPKELEASCLLTQESEETATATFYQRKEAQKEQNIFFTDGTRVLCLKTDSSCFSGLERQEAEKRHDTENKALNQNSSGAASVSESTRAQKDGNNGSVSFYQS